jgi:translation elongation factor EF-G
MQFRSIPILSCGCDNEVSNNSLRVALSRNDVASGMRPSTVMVPFVELHDLIVELRSLTQGAGTFEMKFDHLAELSGKLAETVVATRKAAA